METSKIRNIVKLFIMGESYSSIANKVGVARSTVQAYVEKWREGELGEYSDSIPFEREITEIASYLKSSRLFIKDLREPFLNHQVLACAWHRHG
jgi:transposase-like protein